MTKLLPETSYDSSSAMEWFWNGDTKGGKVHITEYIHHEIIVHLFSVTYLRSKCTARLILRTKMTSTNVNSSNKLQL